MDSNLLTISNILIQTNVTSPSSSKFDVKDVKKENSQFSIEQDREPVNLKEVQSETADNKDEIESLDNNTKYAVKKERPENPNNSDNSLKTQDSTKSENKESSRSNQDDNPTNSEYKVTVGSLVREVARNNEPGGGHQLSKLISSFKENRILPITAHAAKSIENKQLLLSDRKKVGIKTVLPEKSRGKISLKNDVPVEPVKTPSNNTCEQALNVSKMSSTGTKNTTSYNENDIQLKPEVFVNESPKNGTGSRQQFDTKQISTLGIKKEISESGANSVSKTSVTNTKVSLLEANSLQSIDKASESQRKISEKSVNRAPSTQKKLNFEKNVEPRRFKEFSGIKETQQQVKDSIKESNDQTPNITNTQSSQKQTRMNRNTTSSNSINSRVMQINSHNNTPTGTIDQSNPTAENNVITSNLTGQNSSGEVPVNMEKQILDSIQSSLSQQSGDKQIAVRLNPPELGEVFIKFQEQDTQITGLLEVSKTQTRSEIEQILPQIVRHLSDSGINIKRLEVVLTSSEQTEQEAMKDNSLFNNQQQQHNFNDSGLYEGEQDRNKIHEWLDNNVNFENNARLKDALTVENSINILI